MDDSGSGAGEDGGGNAYGARAQDNALINLGGYLHVDENGGGNQRTIQADDSATINIQSGFSYDASEGGNDNKRFIIANDSSTINIMGGELNKGPNSGTNPDLERIDINNDAVINILGHSFFMDGDPLSVPFLDPAEFGAADNFLLSGTLQDGTEFTDLPIFINGSGDALLRLVHTPEPSTIAMWALLGTGLCAFGFARTRRRKRHLT